MFKGKFSLLFFITVSVTFLFFFNTINEASSSLEKDVPEDLIPIMDKIEAGSAVPYPEVKKQRLAEKIQKDYADLKDLFDNNDPKLGKEMAKILGKKATIVFDNETIQGKKDIEKFWDNKRLTHQSVVFTLEWAFIVFEEKITEEMEDYDHIAYESFTFSLIASQAGKILKNQDGRGGRSCRHILGCDCRTR